MLTALRFNIKQIHIRLLVIDFFLLYILTLIYFYFLIIFSWIPSFKKLCASSVNVLVEAIIYWKLKGMFIREVKNINLFNRGRLKLLPFQANDAGSILPVRSKF